MIRLKKENLPLNLVLLYFVWTFFNGIIKKLLISNATLFAINTYIPEIILLLVVFWCLFHLKGLKFNKFEVAGATWFLLVILISLVYCGYSQGVLYVIRDLFFPIYFALVVSKYTFSEKALDHFWRVFKIICMIYLISGAILGMVEFLNGWEWTSQFYTGYTFYGQDEYSSIKITEAYGFLRAPGLTGNHTTFAYYGLVAVMTIIADRNAKLLKKIFFVVCEILILVSTINKTAIVCMALILYIYLFRRLGRTLKYISLVPVGLFVLLYVFSNQSLAFLSSTFDRFDFWSTISSYVSPFEVIIPYNSFSYNPLSSGIISFWDNSYLYFLFAVGIFGEIWILMYVFKLYKQNWNTYQNIGMIFEFLIAFFLAAALFNNITNGRAGFALYFVINSVYFCGKGIGSTHNTELQSHDQALDNKT